MDKQVTAKARRDHRRKMAAKRANELKIKAQKKEWDQTVTANDFQEEFLRKMRTIQNKSIDTKPRAQRRNAAQSTKSSECFKKGPTMTPKPSSPKKESTTKQGSGKDTAEEIKKKEKKHDELKDKKEKEAHNEKGVKEKAEQNTTGKELNINDKKKEMSSGSLKKEQTLEKKAKPSKESASEQDKRKLSGHEAGTRNEKTSSEKKDVKAKDTKSDEKKKEKNVDTEKAQKEREAHEPKEKKITDGEKISKKEPLPEKMQKSSSFSNKKTSKINESSEQKKKRKEDEDDGKQKKEKDQLEKKEKRERDDSNKKDNKGKGDSEKSEKKEKDDSNKKDRKEKNESEKRDKNETGEKKEKTNLTERKRKSVPSKSKTMPSSAAKEEKRKGEDIPEGQESKEHTEHKEKKEKKKGEIDAKKGKGSPHKSSTMRPASKNACQVQAESDKKEKGKVKEVIDERKESEASEPAKTEKKNNTEGQKESLKREDSASGIAAEQTTFYADNTEVPTNEETDVVNGAESDDDINISAESMDDVSEEDIQDAETAPQPEKLETREASAPRLCAPTSTAACTATIKSGVPRMGGRRPQHGRFTTMMPTPQVQLELAARTPVSADKVVVIDNGSSFIKVGFTGEDAPRSVVPAFVARNEATGKYVCGSAAVRMPHAVNPIDPRKPIDWERATVLWKYVLYKELKVDPCDHCVVLSELPTMDVPSQRRMEGVFFDQLCVPGAKVVNSAVTSLFAGGMTTGLVVEIGNRMQVVPVIDTCPINSAVYTQRVGVGDLTERFSRLLLESGIRASTREDMEEVRKLKERCCYVAADYEAEERRPADEIRTTVTFRGREYAISRERYECPEAIFSPFVAGVDAPGLVEIIARTVDKCPIDYRRELLTHILLSGGSTLFPGFEARLKRDLEKLLADRGHVKCSVNIIAMKNRKYLAWTGMAIMASLQTFLKNDIVWVEDYHYAQNADGQTESGEDDNENENENEFANETEIEHEHERLF